MIDCAASRRMTAPVMVNSPLPREIECKQLQRVETERRKLLDAYYAGAVDVVTLRTEQERIGREARSFQDRLTSVGASLEEWQEVLGTAIRFASDCAGAYRRADDRIRTQFNAAVFEELLVRDGRVAEARYRGYSLELWKGSDGSL